MRTVQIWRIDVDPECGQNSRVNDKVDTGKSNIMGAACKPPIQRKTANITYT